MSNGLYSADKAAAHPERLKILRDGGHPYPVHIHLIISDLCNISCPACAYRLPNYSSNQLFGEVDPVTHAVNNNPNRMLHEERVRRIIDDCVEMDTRAIEFTGGGEPTVHPAIGDLLTYAQEKGRETALITNGLLLGKRDLFAVAARTLWTRISIDAATESVYGTVRPSLGGPHGENLRTVLHNLETLRHVRDVMKTDCAIGTGFVVQKENWHEIHEAVRLYREWGADNVRISGVFTPAGDAYHMPHYDAARELERRAIADFDGPDFRVYGRFVEKVDDLHGPPDYETCWYQRFTTYVAGDGNVYRCCVTSYNRHGLLGRLDDHEGSLKALWDAAHERLTNFDARSCERCQFSDRNRSIARLIAKAPDDIAGAPPDHANFVYGGHFAASAAVGNRPVRSHVSTMHRKSASLGGCVVTSMPPRGSRQASTMASTASTRAAVAMSRTMRRIRFGVTGDSPYVARFHIYGRLLGLGMLWNHGRLTTHGTLASIGRLETFGSLLLHGRLWIKRHA